MAYQLVLATDTEITVWHTDIGHIFGFMVDGLRRDLVPRFTRAAPDAEPPTEREVEDAHRFATEQARSRRLIG